MSKAGKRHSRISRAPPVRCSRNAERQNGCKVAHWSIKSRADGRTHQLPLPMRAELNLQGKGPAAHNQGETFAHLGIGPERGEKASVSTKEITASAMVAGSGTTCPWPASRFA